MDMTFSHYVDILRKKGYEEIGEGSFAYVFKHPKINIVIKVFIDDKPYEKFIRRIKDLNNPYFPKVKSIKTYKEPTTDDTPCRWGVVELEELVPFEDLCISEQDKIFEECGNNISNDCYIDSGYTDSTILEFDGMIRYFEDINDEKLRRASEILCELEDSINPCRLDCHGENVMIRKEGKKNRIVFTDPLWKGNWDNSIA